MMFTLFMSMRVGEGKEHVLQFTSSWKEVLLYIYIRKDYLVEFECKFHLSVMNTHGIYLFSQDMMSYILTS